MNGSLVRMALIIVLLQISCNAASAVTWFYSNIRPDGASESNTNSSADASASAGANVYIIPAEDGGQVVSASSSDTEVVSDVVDSGN
jgi:flagellar basal body-associated protein FliL